MRYKLIKGHWENSDNDTFYLEYIHWDDYGYCTEFVASYRDSDGEVHDLGILKIGCENMSSKVKPTLSRNDYPSYSIQELIPEGVFDVLPEDFFSLGQDTSYYKNLNEILGEESLEHYQAIRDIAFNIDRFKDLYEKHNSVLMNSLMRNLHKPVILQFNRIINGNSELTPYSFEFKYDNEKISISVNPELLPPSNIQVLIGRNGVGKTWLLYNIVNKLLSNGGSDFPLEKSKKYKESDRFILDCQRDSFSGIIGMSFSVFDDALCMNIDKKHFENMNGNEYQDKKELFSRKYKYIGLVSNNQSNGKTKTKSIDDLKSEFQNAIERIKKTKSKIALFLETCDYLNADPMFLDNGFIKILTQYFKKNTSDSIYLKNENQTIEIAYVIEFFSKLSSGHMIIILSLTLLSESIYEKTMVVIDEPETHLHPPLLSTYIRALSFLLIKKNAVAIIATHSPIVLQEVPRDCVTRIERNGRDMFFKSIQIESFATSIDTLTREVFQLEVVKTGFYQLIEKELDESFYDTMNRFQDKVGYLGQVLIQSLISQKDNSHEED